jgi:preprotein translocase subunit SecE
MAKQAAKDAGKPNLLKRFLLWWKRFFLAIVKAFKNTYYELKKVTWASKHDLFVYTLVTLGFMVFMGIIIYLIDLGSGALVNLLVSIA